MWADFDPDADQKIPGSDLPDLVSRIPPPMGVAGQDKRKALRFCMTLNLMQEPNGDVCFQDVMDALVNNNFQKQLTEGIPPAEQSDKVAAVLKQREARMSRSSIGGSVAADGAEEDAEREEAVARDFARQLVKMYVRRKRDFLSKRDSCGGDNGGSFTPLSTPSATPMKSRPPPQSPIAAAAAPAEAAAAAYAAAADAAAAAAEPRRVPLPLSRASPVREEPGLPSMLPTSLSTPRSAQIAQLAEENRVLLARLARMQAAADADTRGEERGRQEAEAQRRKHYGIGEYYNGGSGGGGGGGDGDGDGGGGSGASTASITTSSLTPPTAPQRAAAATRMLSPRGAPPRRVAVPPPPDPVPEPPVALTGPQAEARARRRSCDQLTPMQRRAQARAAELRAEHRALRSAADKDPYFA